MRSAQSRRIRTAMAAAVAGLATAATVAATAAPASATATAIHAKYKVTGSTFLKAPNATLPLGPGKLAANLDPSTGNTRWSVRDGANNPSGGAAIGSDGTVYVGGFSNFYAIH